MPELPEVETVRRGLNRLIKGKTIKDVNVLYDKIIVGSKAEFCKKLSGKKLLDIDRRGKYLLFRFSGELTMVSHLRMEGKYFVRRKGEPVEKHTHVIFYFMDGNELH
ncbi:MAG: DNA-formamidopyrimidine glycosylase family protein, partial [Ligilactobacillus ruminis]